MAKAQIRTQKNEKNYHDKLKDNEKSKNDALRQTVRTSNDYRVLADALWNDLTRLVP